MPELFFWKGRLDRVFSLSPVQAEADDESGMSRGCSFVPSKPNGPLGEEPSDEITNLLRTWNGGDQAALDRLAERVYPELHRMARRYMKNERQGNTLQSTALVHEGEVISSLTTCADRGAAQRSAATKVVPCFHMVQNPPLSKPMSHRRIPEAPEIERCTGSNAATARAKTLLADLAIVPLLIIEADGGHLEVELTSLARRKLSVVPVQKSSVLNRPPRDSATNRGPHESSEAVPSQ